MQMGFSHRRARGRGMEWTRRRGVTEAGCQGRAIANIRSLTAVPHGTRLLIPRLLVPVETGARTLWAATSYLQRVIVYSLGGSFPEVSAVVNVRWACVGNLGLCCLCRTSVLLIFADMSCYTRDGLRDGQIENVSNASNMLHSRVRLSHFCSSYTPFALGSTCYFGGSYAEMFDFLGARIPSCGR